MLGPRKEHLWALATGELTCTFSRSTHRPKRMPFSRVLKKFLSVSLITSMPLVENIGSLPIFLMYRFAWPCAVDGDQSGLCPANPTVDRQGASTHASGGTKARDGCLPHSSLNARQDSDTAGCTALNKLRGAADVSQRLYSCDR